MFADSESLQKSLCSSTIWDYATIITTRLLKPILKVISQSLISLSASKVSRQKSECEIYQRLLCFQQATIKTDWLERKFRLLCVCVCVKEHKWRKAEICYSWREVGRGPSSCQDWKQLHPKPDTNTFHRSTTSRWRFMSVREETVQGRCTRMHICWLRR